MKGLRARRREINAQAARAYEEVKSVQRSTNRWTAMNRSLNASQPIPAKNSVGSDPIESEVNAWCMPGGKMAVYTGIMPVLKTRAPLPRSWTAGLLRDSAPWQKRYAGNSGQFAGHHRRRAAIVGVSFFVKRQLSPHDRPGWRRRGFAVAFFDRKSQGRKAGADQAGRSHG